MSEGIKATDVAERERREERETARFLAMMEEFFKRWAPDDPERASYFHAELFVLVRQIYQDASTPYMKALEAAYAHAVFPATIIKDPQK